MCVCVYRYGAVIMVALNATSSLHHPFTIPFTHTFTSLPPPHTSMSLFHFLNLEALKFPWNVCVCVCACAYVCVCVCLYGLNWTGYRLNYLDLYSHLNHSIINQTQNFKIFFWKIKILLKMLGFMFLKPMPACFCFVLHTFKIKCLNGKIK